MIPDEAVEAAVIAVYGESDLPEKLGEFGAEVRMILEAAAPHLMARLLQEASEKVGKRYAHLYQMRQDELMAKAWDEGAVAEAWGINAKDRNPYRKEVNHEHQQ